MQWDDMLNANDHPWLGWVIGLVVTVISGLLGHLHMRINRLEDRVNDNHVLLQEQLGGADEKLRAELIDMRRDEAAFRERLLREMASKDDIRDLRTSLERLASDLSSLRIGCN